jgi:class 3 adenylate cyclase
MDQKNNPTIANHLIAVYDLENFVQLAKKFTQSEIFILLHELQILVIDTLIPLNPLVIKNMGDANLMVFTEENLDEKLLTLLELKGSIEAYLKNRGHHHRAAFSAHYGEVAVGLFGREPFVARDAFGEAINITFLMNGKPFRGRFGISPQLFRKLASEARTSFHKYTPPVVYLAE